MKYDMKFDFLIVLEQLLCLVSDIYVLAVEPAGFEDHKQIAFPWKQFKIQLPYHFYYIRQLMKEVVNF